MTQVLLGNQAIAQSQSNLHADLAPDYEIDSDEDGDFGTLYRLWKSYIFLGSFYQNLTGKWIAQPANSDCRAECDTEYQAQLVILAIQGLVIPCGFGSDARRLANASLSESTETAKTPTASPAAA